MHAGPATITQRGTAVTVQVAYEYHTHSQHGVTWQGSWTAAHPADALQPGLGTLRLDTGEVGAIRITAVTHPDSGVFEGVGYWPEAV